MRSLDLYTMYLPKTVTLNGEVHYKDHDNSDISEPCLEHAEADTFFCFSNLMVEIGQHFTKKLDRSRAGIGTCVSLSY